MRIPCSSRVLSLLLFLPSVLAVASFPPLTEPSSASSAAKTASATGTNTLPAITTGAATSNNIPAPSTFTTPVATVPPTASAPFMQKSSLPTNFVFICVGAIIAFFFAIVIIWRCATSWSIKRSVKSAGDSPFGINKRSAAAFGKLQKLNSEASTLLKKPQAPFYSQGPGSALSLDALTSGTGKKDSSKAAERASLFFSPTAGVGTHSASPVPGNRSSTYLPAGYYAAGQSGAGGGATGNERPISMADFTNNSYNSNYNTRPQSQGYSHSYGCARSAGPNPSPDPSPLLSPTNPPDIPYTRSSTARLSTASLGARSDGRAPSAYLEELFDYPPVPERGAGERRF